MNEWISEGYLEFKQSFKCFISKHFIEIGRKLFVNLNKLWYIVSKSTRTEDFTSTCENFTSTCGYFFMDIFDVHVDCMLPQKSFCLRFHIKSGTAPKKLSQVL